MALKTIFLDLDHTLCDTDASDAKAHRVVHAWLRERAPEVDGPAVTDAYTQCVADTPLDPRGVEPVQRWRIGLWARVLAEHRPELETHAEAVHDIFFRERMGFLTFIPGVEALLADLRRRFTTWVVTNGDSSIQWPKVRALELEKHVDGFVVSGDKGIHKPDARIFLEVCGELGCRPDEAIHVGDGLATDILGAINAGLAASVWVNPRGRSLGPDDPRPTHQVVSVLEIASLVDRIDESMSDGD